MKTREKVLHLLVKLQAMADETQSRSPEEAAIAAAHMQKLMFEHKIGMAEIAGALEEDPLTDVDVLQKEGQAAVIGLLPEGGVSPDAEDEQVARSPANDGCGDRLVFRDAALSRPQGVIALSEVLDRLVQSGQLASSIRCHHCGDFVGRFVDKRKRIC